MFNFKTLIESHNLLEYYDYIIVLCIALMF